MTGLLIQPNAHCDTRNETVPESDRASLIDLQPIRGGLAMPPTAAERADTAASIEASSVPWVIIGAVVAAIMPPGTRIRQVVEIGVPAWNLWAVEGRRDHFGTHRVR